MRRSFFYCLLLLLPAEAAYAQAKASHFDTPVWGGGRSLITPPAVDPPNNSNDRPNVPPSGGHGGHDHNHGQHPRRPHWNYGPGWSTGGWNSGFGWYLPPVFVSPTFSNFGYTYSLPYTAPAPIVPPTKPLNWLAPAPDPAAAAPAPAADPLPPGRISSPDQKARAGRYLSYGDNLFMKQKYLAALGRYKSASDAANDMAESYLRQGFAYVAMGQYDHATKAIRRGLTLRSNWQGAAFRLSTLYDGAEAAKTQHIERLALAVEGNPFDSGLLMTLGVELFFDGQFDRAELCFQNAARLGGGDESLVADFLTGAKAGGAPAPAKGRKVSF